MLRKREAPQGNVVVVVDKRPILEEDLGLRGGLLGVMGQQTLIEVLRGRQRRPIS